MSNANDLIIQTSQFLGDLKALLTSTTVETLIELLDEAGDDDAVHLILVQLANLLDGVHAQLVALVNTIDEPLRHASALSGLLGLLAPLMTGLQRLVDTSAEDLAAAGLDRVMHITQPIREGVRFGGDVLVVGQGVLDGLPDPALLQTLADSFADLIATVDAYVAATA